MNLEALRMNPAWRARVTRFAEFLNRTGVALIVRSRRLVHFLNATMTDREAERFLLELPTLHHEVSEHLASQRRNYPHVPYFYGYPYQGLAILGIFGERATEERFDTYGLAKLIGRDDTVLDIGCNCGFMSLITAYRTGCRAVGIDINPHMIDIGNACAKYLRLDDRVTLQPGRFQEFSPKGKFSVVFSFATHWTDDGNYRVSLQAHLQRIHSMMAPDGVLVFESHCADVGNDNFYRALDEVRPIFDIDVSKKIENDTRLVYLMRRRG